MRKMPTLYMHDFEVEGSGEFPVDMLRYDSCWPISSEDAGRIAQQEYGRRTVRLRCHRERYAQIATIGRWKSFTWKVTIIDGSPVDA